MRPLIGITADRGRNKYGQGTSELGEAYLQAVLDAGGWPVVIPSIAIQPPDQGIYERLDGILFSGGGDVDPERFGGAPHPCIAGVDPHRDALELQFVRRTLTDGKPFFGICRGIQVINVGLGGTLYTHLPDQLERALHHDNPGDHRRDLVHEVTLVDGSRLGKITGEPTLRVNSHHHQGLKRLAPPLRAVGYSADGLVEAIELPEHPFGLAVQWHPEWLTDMKSTRLLFESFVEAAASQRR